MNNIESLLDSYIVWLKDKTILKSLKSGWMEITTPYLDRHNDYIQIYVKEEDGHYFLTDDGYAIGDLEQCGCNLDSPKRKLLLQQTLNGFGVECDNNVLTVKADNADFAVKKHSLVQAILSINDLFYLAEPYVHSIFYEDVVAWLDLNDVRYTSKIKLTGKTGFDYLFDFVVPKSKVQPERILQTVTRPSKDTAQKVVLSWLDTREVRPPDSRAYAILNDTEHSVSESVLQALSSYDVNPVLWSQRDQLKPQIVN